MTLEKPLIEGYVLYTHNVFVTYFNDLINQQKRKAMWQLTFNIFQIIYGRFIEIVTGNVRIVLIFFNVLFYLFCKLDIAAMTRAVGDDMGLNWIPDQGKITD